MNDLFETRQNTKKAGRKRRPGFLVRSLRALFNATLLVGTSAVVGIVVLHLVVVDEYEGRLDRTFPDLIEDSYVYAANGERIGAFAAEESRETVGFEGLGGHLPAAVVAVEDRRFYDHLGVDFEGLGRAAWTDLRRWEVQEGGSTITEQLAKNLYVPPGERLEVSFWRRFVQSSLAFSYERGHTKEEILTAYLNTVYFGNGAYGAQTAAQRFFGEDADELTLAQAATLVGFLRAPSTYVALDGTVDAERAQARRDEVLGLMREQGAISVAEHEDAVASPMEFAPGPPHGDPGDPVYEPFLEKVRREVEAELGPVALERGGLRIRTTLDPEVQRAAVESSAETLPEPDDPSAAVVTMDPQSGAVRALAGQDGDFNLALDARRQPGSSFKPVVLATALREGISPESTYVSKELAFRFGDEYYAVENYDSVERGEISVAEAMAESDNTVFVQLAADLGLADVVETADALGVTTPVEAYPSTAIGGLGVGVSPLEMASAYSTFAGGGLHRAPYAVESVDRAGYGRTTNIFDHRISARRAMTGNQAAAANGVLRGVVESGTASVLHDLDEEIGKPSAGKTGTTDDFADAWYVGYTPRLCTAVWVGYPDARRSMSGVHGIEEPNGETLPMDIWSSHMARATEGDLPLGFPEADMGEFVVSAESPPAGS